MPHFTSDIDNGADFERLPGGFDAELCRDTGSGDPRASGLNQDPAPGSRTTTALVRDDAGRAAFQATLSLISRRIG